MAKNSFRDWDVRHYEINNKRKDWNAIIIGVLFGLFFTALLTLYIDNLLLRNFISDHQSINACSERMCYQSSQVSSNRESATDKGSVRLIPQAQAFEGVKTAPENIEAIIREEWKESAEVGLKLAFCESTYNPEAKNRTSSASGLFQITSSTWTENRRRMGLDTSLELRFDARENAKTAYFIYQHRGTQPWVSSSHCSGV